MECIVVQIASLNQSSRPTAVMSALSEESEKDVLPWLKLAEDLRRLKLDVEV